MELNQNLGMAKPLIVLQQILAYYTCVTNLTVPILKMYRWKVFHALGADPY